MSIAGVPISLWQQLSNVADVRFVGAGGQAPIITAKPELATANINPFSDARSDSFTLADPLMSPNLPVNQADVQGRTAPNPALSIRHNPQDQGQSPPQHSVFVPPGLAKKNTGGLPPGIAKRINAGNQKPQGYAP